LSRTYERGPTRAERASYYTAVAGDEDKLLTTKLALREPPDKEVKLRIG
jgi:hypothetical protein